MIYKSFKKFVFWGFVYSIINILSCAQSVTPELKVCCSIQFPIDNHDYRIKILAGKFEIRTIHDINFYDITFFEVSGGHTTIFGRKYNDINGYNSPRLIIFKDNIKYAKYSYNDIINFDSFKQDTLTIFKIPEIK